MMLHLMVVHTRLLAHHSYFLVDSLAVDNRLMAVVGDHKSWMVRLLVVHIQQLVLVVGHKTKLEHVVEVRMRVVVRSQVVSIPAVGLVVEVHKKHLAH